MTTSGRNSSSVSGSTCPRSWSQRLGERHVAVGRHLAATHEAAPRRHHQADVRECRVGAGPPGEPNAERFGRRVADHQHAHRPGRRRFAACGIRQRRDHRRRPLDAGHRICGSRRLDRCRNARRGRSCGDRRLDRFERRCRRGGLGRRHPGDQRRDVVRRRPPVVVGDRHRDEDRRHGDGRWWRRARRRASGAAASRRAGSGARSRRTTTWRREPSPPPGARATPDR